MSRNLNGFIERKRARMLINRAYLRGEREGVRKILTRLLKYGSLVNRQLILDIAEEWEMVLDVYYNI